jgi:hypothetical protein
MQQTATCFRCYSGDQSAFLQRYCSEGYGISHFRYPEGIQTVVAPRALECGEYPELAGSISRLLKLLRIVQKSRGFICKPRGLRPVFHVLESTVVERYEVDIPEDESDRKFIKAALTAARHEDVVYLVTYDSGLLGVDPGKLRERYQEAEKVKIVDPKETVERLKSAGSR